MMLIKELPSSVSSWLFCKCNRLFWCTCFHSMYLVCILRERRTVFPRMPLNNMKTMGPKLLHSSATQNKQAIIITWWKREWLVRNVWIDWRETLRISSQRWESFWCSELTQARAQYAQLLACSAILKPIFPTAEDFLINF